MFPRIESPCPLQSIQLPQTGRFNCSACQREVHDLSAMSVDERKIFLNQCSGKVCVSYKVTSNVKNLKKSAIAGLFVITASGLAVQAAALTGDTLLQDTYDEILVGGINLPEQTDNDKLQEAESAIERETTELIPVVEETDNFSHPLTM
ncbi:MAG: hypothetical protein V4732_20855 [Pseudomonadota bacterium]